MSGLLEKIVAEGKTVSPKEGNLNLDTFRSAVDDIQKNYKPMTSHLVVNGKSLKEMNKEALMLLVASFDVMTDSEGYEYLKQNGLA